jgi:hypothetical protein
MTRYGQGRVREPGVTRAVVGFPSGLFGRDAFASREKRPGLGCQMVAANWGAAVLGTAVRYAGPLVASEFTVPPESLRKNLCEW